MTKQILVTYASRTGWTEGVAEAIAKTLSEGGAQVELLPMSEVRDITPYKAVVAGSAIRDRQWLPEAVQFMRNYQADLNRLPVAIFTVCLTLAMRNAEAYRPQISAWMDPVRQLVKPVGDGMFAGGLDIKRLSPSERLKFRISVLLGVWKEGDHRDWQAIKTWAREIALKL
jgi:menaquinone-dependent protoporphyrinogen oxidase